jgi:hypothetical protein
MPIRTVLNNRLEHEIVSHKDRPFPHEVQAVQDAVGVQCGENLVRAFTSTASPEAKPAMHKPHSQSAKPLKADIAHLDTLE